MKFKGVVLVGKLFKWFKAWKEITSSKKVLELVFERSLMIRNYMPCLETLLVKLSNIDYLLYQSNIINILSNFMEF